MVLDLSIVLNYDLEEEVDQIADCDEIVRYVTNFELFGLNNVSNGRISPFLDESGDIGGSVLRIEIRRIEGESFAGKALQRVNFPQGVAYVLLFDELLEISRLTVFFFVRGDFLHLNFEKLGFTKMIFLPC